MKTKIAILALIATATMANAQWQPTLPVGPAVVNASPGTFVAASFDITGSQSYASRDLTLAAPVVVWAVNAPATAYSTTVSETAVSVDQYGEVFAAQPLVVSWNWTIPVGTPHGAQYIGTVYEPVKGTRAGVANAVGQVIINVQ